MGSSGGAWFEGDVKRGPPHTTTRVADLPDQCVIECDKLWVHVHCASWMLDWHEAPVGPFFDSGKNESVSTTTMTESTDPPRVAYILRILSMPSSACQADIRPNGAHNCSEPIPNYLRVGSRIPRTDRVHRINIAAIWV